MEVKIQLGPELYDHIRNLVHDELNEQKNRERFERLALTIRGQLDELSSPDKSATVLRIDLGTVRSN